MDKKNIENEEVLKSISMDPVRSYFMFMAEAYLREKNVIVYVVPKTFNADGKCVEWGYETWFMDNFEESGEVFEDYYDAMVAGLINGLEQLKKHETT